MKSKSPKRFAFLRGEFGTQLRQLRQSASLTQKQLAVNCGLSQGAISKWESGESDPLWSEVIKLALALKVTPNDFLTSGRLMASQENRELFQNGGISQAPRFGNRLRTLRQQRDCPQYRLQDSMERYVIGGRGRIPSITAGGGGMVSAWESGKREPRWSAVVALAMALSKEAIVEYEIRTCGDGVRRPVSISKWIEVRPNDFL